MSLRAVPSTITALAPMHGWSLFSGAEQRSPVVHAVSRTKKDLLLGLDMITLRGLRRCERELAAAGRHLHRCVVRAAREGETATGYLATVGGRLAPQLLWWSGIASTPARAADSVAQLLEAVDRERTGDVRRFVPSWARGLTRQVILTADERQALVRFAVRRSSGLATDGRRRSTLAEVVAATDAVFARLGVTIVPVVVERATTSATARSPPTRCTDRRGIATRHGGAGAVVGPDTTPTPLIRSNDADRPHPHRHHAGPDPGERHRVLP